MINAIVVVSTMPGEDTHGLVYSSDPFTAERLRTDFCVMAGNFQVVLDAVTPVHFYHVSDTVFNCRRERHKHGAVACFYPSDRIA